MKLSEDYLSPEKRAQVEAFKVRIKAGEFNHSGIGFITDRSIDVTELIRQAMYQDEMGPWSVEEDHTEFDLAQYELALENWETQIRAEVRAEVLAELAAKKQQSSAT